MCVNKDVVLLYRRWFWVKICGNFVEAKIQIKLKIENGILKIKN